MKEQCSIKDRTESFDDYFLARKNKCRLNHIRQWFKLFAYEHNKEISLKLTELLSGLFISIFTGISIFGKEILDILIGFYVHLFRER
ncbi:MAG TPA: hypothetical protein VN704_13420, partial [Verrucomicrobiae bacterium]|nr:hypothetical protein [Verrucomicrobiae bacterium]